MTGFSTISPRTADFSALRFDPAPGSLPDVEALADQFELVARQLDDAHHSLRNIQVGNGTWTGEAANHFATAITEFMPLVGMGAESFTDASRALRDWATLLATFQDKAARLEAEAKAALRVVVAAEANPDLHITVGDLAAVDRHRQARQQLDSANEVLEHIRWQARQLLQEHQRTADDIARRLDAAADKAPDGPRWLERFAQAFHNVLEALLDLGELGWEFIEENAELIGAISAVMGELSSYLGMTAAVLAVMPFGFTQAAAAVIGPAALGLGVAATIGSAVAATAGADNTDWSDVAMNGAGLIPFGQIAGKAAPALGLAGSGAVLSDVVDILHTPVLYHVDAARTGTLHEMNPSPIVHGAERIKNSVLDLGDEISASQESRSN
ncbi:hypothetical protein IEU95_10235 [Hoyosella rhizosphaerae]|nr:hypothetical protein [Hoyosella rhizosphaerae]MBN4927213.1 hypothetical protein [Hoyosella rhizosphaerae]